MEQLVMFPFEIERFQNILNETVQKSLTSFFDSQEKVNESTEILKIKDIASLLDVSESTIHNYKREGIIPYHKIGRRTYFKRNEILESLNQIKNGV